MTSQQIEYFLAICGNHSFSKTAAQFYVTQPTISLQISALEKSLGVALFERTRNRVIMTEAGQEYFEFFKQGKGQLEQIKARFSRNRTANELAIGVLHAMQPPELREIVSEFHKRYPDIQIHVSEFHPDQTDKTASFLEKNLDAIFTIANPMHEDTTLNSKKVASVRFVMMVSREDPLLQNARVSPADFSSRTLFLPNPTADSGFQKTLQKIKYRYNWQHMRTEILSSMHAVDFAVFCGLGVTVACESTIYDKSQIAVLDIEEQSDFVAVWHNDNNNPALKTFLSFLDERGTE